ncbi:MAG: hypothetical protein J3R72DRAFT_439779 [Linnemannia gamsii]|nr:MAG: hypothetical protein J3R72DRAFT_439779 [Linnemannia gamsii]
MCRVHRIAVSMLQPLINFVIGSAALSFQVGVLYPWHHQLDGDFKDLENKHEKRLQLFHDRKWEKLMEIDSKLESLLKKQKMDEADK